MVKWTTSVVVIVLLGAPMLVWAQSKVMTFAELGDFLIEQIKAYKVINDPDSELEIKRLLRQPETYAGKVVLVVATGPGLVRESQSEFIEPTTSQVFNGYGIKNTMKVLRFGERFVLIGQWRKGDYPYRGMDVYKICGLVVDRRAGKTEVLCETLKEP